MPSQCESKDRERRDLRVLGLPSGEDTFLLQRPTLQFCLLGEDRRLFRTGETEACTGLASAERTEHPGPSPLHPPGQTWGRWEKHGGASGCKEGTCRAQLLRGGCGRPLRGSAAPPRGHEGTAELAAGRSAGRRCPRSGRRAREGGLTSSEGAFPGPFTGRTGGLWVPRPPLPAVHLLSYWGNRQHRD